MTTAAFKRLRKAVMSRAGGFCECGCGRWIGDEGHLDHWFGRGAGRPEEAVSNCWALSPPCDHQKTNWSPSAQSWVERFITHCMKHGYLAEVDLAQARLGMLTAKGLTT